MKTNPECHSAFAAFQVTKKNTHRWPFWGALAIAVNTLAWLTGCSHEQSSGDLGGLEQASAAARAHDPAWKPSYKQTSVIYVGKKGQGGLVHSFCLAPTGDLLVACGGEVWMERTDSNAKPESVKVPTEIRVYSPEGQLRSQWPVPIKPQAICVIKSGVIFVGGQGKLAKLDPQGKVLLVAESPAMMEKSESDQTLMERIKKEYSITDDKRAEQMVAGIKGRKQTVTALSANDTHVYVTCPSPGDYSFWTYEVDHDFKQPKALIKKLQGCCSQMDVLADANKLWVAHNGKHLVETYDTAGNLTAKFGKYDRKAAAGFGGCCEPKNLRLAPNGEVLAAESGPPVVIKRFSPDGKFLGVMGLPDFKSGCVRVTIDLSADEKRLYILSTGEDAIYVLSPAL